MRDLSGALLFKLVRSLLALMTLSRVNILNRFFTHSLDVAECRPLQSSAIYRKSHTGSSWRYTV